MSVSDCNMKQFVNNEEMDGMLGGPVLYDARRTFFAGDGKGMQYFHLGKKCKV